MTDDLILTQKVANILRNASKFLAFPIENDFDPTYSVNFTATYWPIVISIVFTYLSVIFFGSKIMQKYAPFNLRLPLAAWNGFLCLFSFIGMLRTVNIHFFILINLFTFHLTLKYKNVFAGSFSYCFYFDG